MNSEPLDPHWVRTWAADITAHLQVVLSAFDSYYPYPPGQNEVVLAGPEPTDTSGLPPDLITFYGVVHEVVMSDIGNAFFIHSPDDVITRLADDPVLLDDGATATIFASNGGGLLYAISPANEVCRSSGSGFEPVATSLQGFLEQVRDAVAGFVATRTPGNL